MTSVPKEEDSAYQEPRFYMAESLYDGDVLPDELVGYYPQFVGVDGGFFGFSVPIKEIEVTA